jgi:hypothetical protein
MANGATDAHILDDRGIDSGTNGGLEVGFDGGEFAGENEGIEGELAFYAALMEECHEFG